MNDFFSNHAGNHLHGLFAAQHADAVLGLREVEAVAAVLVLVPAGTDAPVEAAAADLRPARMGATVVDHRIYKGNIAGATLAGIKYTRIIP